MARSVGAFSPDSSSSYEHSSSFKSSANPSLPMSLSSRFLEFSSNSSSIPPSSIPSSSIPSSSICSSSVKDDTPISTYKSIPSSVVRPQQPQQEKNSNVDAKNEDVYYRLSTTGIIVVENDDCLVSSLSSPNYSISNTPPKATPRSRGNPLDRLVFEDESEDIGIEIKTNEGLKNVKSLPNLSKLMEKTKEKGFNYFFHRPEGVGSKSPNKNDDDDDQAGIITSRKMSLDSNLPPPPTPQTPSSTSPSSSSVMPNDESFRKPFSETVCNKALQESLSRLIHFSASSVASVSGKSTPNLSTHKHTCRNWNSKIDGVTMMSRAEFTKLVLRTWPSQSYLNSVDMSVDDKFLSPYVTDITGRLGIEKLPSFSGHLYKRPGLRCSGLGVISWHRYFFVLDQCHLFWFRNHSTYQEQGLEGCCGSISFIMSDVIVDQDIQHTRRFLLKNKKSEHIFLFDTLKSEFDRGVWMVYLLGHANKGYQIRTRCPDLMWNFLDLKAQQIRRRYLNSTSYLSFGKPYTTEVEMNVEENSSRH